jgi:hypothetical protein
MVGKADPAIFGDVDHFRRRPFARIDVKIGDVVVVDLTEFTIGLAHHAFMQDEKTLEVLRLAVARDHAIGRKALGAGGRVLNRLGDGEHVVLVDRDDAAEGQPGLVGPDQGVKL